MFQFFNDDTRCWRKEETLHVPDSGMEKMRKHSVEFWLRQWCWYGNNSFYKCLSWHTRKIQSKFPKFRFLIDCMNVRTQKKIYICEVWGFWFSICSMEKWGYCSTMCIDFCPLNDIESHQTKSHHRHNRYFSNHSLLLWVGWNVESVNFCVWI